MKRWPLLFFILPFLAFGDPITVDLRNPSYKDGILYTSEGGVVRGQDLRIQAKIIEYERKEQVHTIKAQGDLMVQYKGRVFVGSRFTFDFLQNEGTVFDGKTFTSLWYVGGEKIELHADGSYTVENASITASENKDSAYDLFAGRIEAMKHDLFIGKNIQFRLFKVPTFWLPSLKLNLKKSSKDPIARYTLNWDKGQGLRAATRYQLYSWRDFALFGRVEYRWSTGWGGAIETEYFPPDANTSFTTRSYVGTDRLETAPNKQFRFRLEGAHHWRSRDEKTNTALLWDKYSDVRMPSDFKSDDFEVGTARQTLFWVHHREPFAIFNFKTRPRLNAFESLKQDLPTFYVNVLPREIGPTGILSSSYLKGAYLDFAYSNQLASTPSLVPPSDYRSGRFELREKLHRPFSLGPLTLTPHLGAVGILYTNSQSHHIKPLGLLSYGADLCLSAQKKGPEWIHIIRPYGAFSSLTKPTISPDDHYIFSIQDGYNKINQIKVGVQNLLFSKNTFSKGPLFSADLFANAFFSDPTIPQFIPRLYLWLGCSLPTVDLSLQSAWNFRNSCLDYSNARCRWTVNEHIAMTLEARFRSEYDWRKADHENFILDVTRSESELLSSPLSDRRITLLANLFIRLSPFWECHLESHHGFYRFTEDPYNEFKVDLFTWISSALKLRISYSHTDKDDRIAGGISLIKK